MKKNSDIIIIVIGIIVLSIGIIAYVLLGTNFNKSKDFFSDTLVTGNTESIKNETDDRLYNFLSDTKDVYCDYVGWINYFRELANKEKSKGNGSDIYNFRIINKKTLLEDSNVGLNDIINKYYSGYYNYSFPKTVKLLKSAYENHKISHEYFSKVEKNKDEFYENGLVYRESGLHSFEQIPETLLEEYKSIRGNDEKLRPKNEVKLLKLKLLCPELELTGGTITYSLEEAMTDLTELKRLGVDYAEIKDVMEQVYGIKDIEEFVGAYNEWVEGGKKGKFLYYEDIM